MENSESPITPGMSYNLNLEEIVELRKKSLEGDAEASKRLWLFYEFTTGEYDKAAVWLTKAAEQGLADAQYNLAFDFSRPEGPRYDLEKAKYWAAKAVNSGEALASRLLEDIRKIEDSGDHN